MWSPETGNRIHCLTRYWMGAIVLSLLLYWLPRLFLLLAENGESLTVTRYELGLLVLLCFELGFLVF